MNLKIKVLLLNIISFVYISIIPAVGFPRSVSEVDSILVVLNEEILLKSDYMAQKEQAIELLKAQIQRTTDNGRLYELSTNLFDAYKSYQYDSAYYYAQQTLEYADCLGDIDLKTKAGSNLLFCFFSTGLFTEAVGVVHQTKLDSSTSDSVRADFYALCARLYSDMANYNNLRPYREEYERLQIAYCDSALRYLEPGTYKYDEVLALRILYAEHDVKMAMYKHLIDDFAVNDHQLAINASNVANLYISKGDTVSALYNWALSAISDIRSSTKETTAMTNLAECLYQIGDVRLASRYINEALDDANFYNARHRVISINSIMPIIERENLAIIESQRVELRNSLIVMSLLAFLFLLSSAVVYFQNRRLGRAKSVIEQQNEELAEVNRLLEQSGSKLEELNQIKDVYIMQSLYAKSEYLERMTDFTSRLSNRVRAKKYDELLKLSGEFNLRDERRDFFSTFDNAFLILFPTFVEQYNELFSVEGRVVLEREGVLTAELRIFALTRLGVSDSEKIARFLDLSINTIYAYKAKAKGRSIVSKDEFEHRVMQISQ